MIPYAMSSFIVMDVHDYPKADGASIVDHAVECVEIAVGVVQHAPRRGQNSRAIETESHHVRQGGLEGHLT